MPPLDPIEQERLAELNRDRLHDKATAITKPNLRPLNAVVKTVQNEIALEDSPPQLELLHRANLLRIRFAEALEHPEKLGREIAQRLNKEIEEGHATAAFSIALLFAAVKDVLDLGLTVTLIKFVPVGGQLPGIILTAFIIYFLWGKGSFKKTKLRLLWWLLGFVFDNLPGFDMLPVSTLLVLYSWHVVRKRADAAKEELKKTSARIEYQKQQIRKQAAYAQEEATYAAA